jgi:hypothetical protein
MTFQATLKELRKNENTLNAGTKWTIDEDNKLIQEINDNKSYDEIALEHKRSIIAIKSRVISHIIYPKYKDSIENDIEAISIEYKIENDLIMKYINKIKLNNSNPKTINKNESNIKINKNEILEYLQKLDKKIDMILNHLKI